MTFFSQQEIPYSALIIKAKGKCRQLNHARLLNRYEKGTVKFVSRTEFRIRNSIAKLSCCMAIALHLDLKCIDVDTLIVKIFSPTKAKVL